MSGRLLRYTGERSGEPTFTMPDGTVVAVGETAEFDPRYAAKELLPRPGGLRDWEPQSRPDAEPENA